jgi:hypothetical protein
VLAVAKARGLFKTGWQVHVVDADGRVFHSEKLDHLLSFLPSRWPNRTPVLAGVSWSVDQTHHSFAVSFDQERARRRSCRVRNCLGILELGLIAFQVSSVLLNQGLTGTRINLREQVAGMHGLAFGEVDADDLPWICARTMSVLYAITVPTPLK